MKHTLKKSLAIILAAATILCCAPLSGIADLELPEFGEFKKLANSVSDFFDGFAPKAEATTSGTCGDNLTWTFDELTSTLTISGTGDMWDSSYESNRRAPWYNLRSSVKSVIIKNGVTCIGDYAFEEHRNLVDITVSDSVKSIGRCAFEFCVNLKNISIPDSVTSIGSRAFYSSGLYNNNANWENCVFYIEKHLIEADLPDSETYKIKDGTINIADYAFNSCNNISNIIFPNSVLSIGNGAFYCCDGLIDVDIPDSVLRIGEYAFSNCECLEKVLIGDGVTALGESSFQSCSNLDTVVIGNSLTNIEKYTFDECVSLTSVTIGNNVKTISKGAFSDCSSLVSLVIPDSVEQILEYSFNNCTNIASLTIGKGVKFISEDAFNDCSALNDIYYTGDIAGWCTMSFEGESPVEYADNIFINGILIEGNLVIPEGITSIGDYSFINYSKITQVTIPGSVKVIGISAFEKCSNLVKVASGNQITNIGNYAFKECANLQNITLSNNLLNIGEEAFYGCTSLEKVTIPDSISIIGSAAFYECTNLVDLVVGCGVTEIGLYAFAQCEKLKNVTIRSGVKSIGAGSFKDCTSLEIIVIPDSVTNIGEWAFDSCSNLITVTIGNGVTNIGDSAFSCCFNLKNLKIGENLENIGMYAFNSCNNLTNINLPDSIKNIGDYAFRSSGVTNLMLPEGLESIGAYIFANCSGITKITIPSSVTNISELAFETAQEIISINVDNNNKFYSNDSYGVLFNKDKSELIKFPEGKIIWEYSIPSSVKIISNNAFSACWYLENGNIYYDGTEAEWNAISIGSNNDPLLNATIHYNYQPIAVTGIDIPESKIQMNGETMVVSANIYPENATDRRIIWRTSNPDVATIDVETGTLTAKSNGYTVVTATAADGFFTDSCLVFVGKNTMTVSSEDGNDIIKGNTHKIYISLVDLDGMSIAKNGKARIDSISKDQIDKTVFTVADSSVASITSIKEWTKNGRILEVKGNSIGSTYITMSNNDTGEVKYLPIYVVSEENTFTTETICETDEGHRGTMNFRHNGIYIYDYQKESNDDGSVDIKFNAYNNNTNNGSIEVYTENGTLVKSYMLEAHNGGDPTSVDENCEMIGAILATWWNLDPYDPTSMVSSTKTEVDCTVPKNGYIKITNDVTDSKICLVYNIMDLVVSTVSLSGDISGFADLDSETTKKVAEKTSEKVIKAIIDTSGSIIKKIIKEIINELSKPETLENRENLFDLVEQLLDVLDLKFGEILAESIWDVTKKKITDLGLEALGVYGKTVKGLYAYNAFLQLYNLILESDDSIGSGSAYIYAQQSGDIKTSNGIVFKGKSDTETVFRTYAITYGDIYVEASNLYGAEDFELYDISLVKDGNTVQPSEKVQVSIPIPKDWNKNKVKVYRVTLDGAYMQYEDMKGKVDGNYIVFETDHFSYYAIVEEISAHTHSYTSTITTPANCTKNGVMTFTCECGDSYTETTPATGHTKGSWVTSIEPDCINNGEKICRCSICGEVCESEIISATGHTEGEWITVLEPTTETEGKKVKKCTVCGVTLREAAIEKPLKEPVKDSAVVKSPSTTTISYGDSIVLHVDKSKIPEGGRVEWTADNGNFSYKADGATCTISPAKSGDTTFTATIYDANGNPVSTDEQTMTSKAGFFDKIIAFFKKLFGLTKTYPDIFEI